MVRRLQPDSARRGEPCAPAASPDHESCRCQRPDRGQSGAGRQKKSPHETHPVSVDRGDRQASPSPGPAGGRTTLAHAAGRNHSPAPADRLPEGRDPQAEMVRGRRRRAQAGRSQDRPADGLVERSRAGHRRPPDAYGERLCLPVSQRPGEVVLRHFGTVVPGEEGSRDRGHPPARPETHGRKSGGDPGRRAVDGCKDARALRPENDVALRPCQRPGRGSRRGADREGDRGCHDGRAIAQPDRSDSPGDGSDWGAR